METVAFLGINAFDQQRLNKVQPSRMTEDFLWFRAWIQIWEIN